MAARDSGRDVSSPPSAAGRSEIQTFASASPRVVSVGTTLAGRFKLKQTMDIPEIGQDEQYTNHIRRMWGRIMDEDSIRI
ncbi:uncharacterized protein TrAtP1_000262 [Trichoderma atroviride]|uniref:uncharacterized protein n=1 Tax=Hypocrea atroviridis TaxID=63577 RepID=UPI003321F2BC|nr:hypothetical protein TrAtP1_000262 [Trichoderma atroviride]